MDHERDQIVAQMQQCVAALQQRVSREVQLRNAAEARAMKAVATERAVAARLERAVQDAASAGNALVTEIESIKAQTRRCRAEVQAKQQQIEIQISGAMQAIYRRQSELFSSRNELNKSLNPVSEQDMELSGTVCQQQGNAVQASQGLRSSQNIVISAHAGLDKSGQDCSARQGSETQQNKIAQLQNELQNARDERQMAQDEASSTRNELQRAERTLLRSHTDLSNTQAELQNARNALYKTQSDLGKARAELQDTHAQLHFQEGQLSAQIQLQASQLRENDTKIACLQRSLDTLLAEPTGQEASTRHGQPAQCTCPQEDQQQSACDGIGNESVELIVDALAHRMQQAGSAEREALAARQETINAQQRTINALSDVVRRQSECMADQQRQLCGATFQSQKSQLEALESQAASSAQNEQIASLNAQIDQLQSDNLRLSRLQDDDERRDLLKSISDSYRMLQEKDDMIVQLSAMLRAAD